MNETKDVKAIFLQFLNKVSLEFIVILLFKKKSLMLIEDHLVIYRPAPIHL